jgi:hypothetical protein
MHVKRERFAHLIYSEILQPVDRNKFFASGKQAKGFLKKFKERDKNSTPHTMYP